MTLLDALVGAAIVLGVVGVVVPVLPGLVLVWAAVLVWSLERHDTTGWVVLALATACFAAGQVGKYALPGRAMKRAGVPLRTTVLGGLLAAVGFFVVPVVGLVLGFVAGVYLAERARLRAHRAAWRSTVHALRASGWSILIELATALLIASIWALALLT